MILGFNKPIKRLNCQLFRRRELFYTECKSTGLAAGLLTSRCRCELIPELHCWTTSLGCHLDSLQKCASWGLAFRRFHRRED